MKIAEAGSVQSIINRLESLERENPSLDTKNQYKEALQALRRLKLAIENKT